LNREQQGLAHEELGQLALQAGRYDEAVTYFQKSLECSPRESSLEHSLAMALSLSGDKEQARKHEDRFQRIRASYDRMSKVTRRLVDEPENADLRCEAGEILISQGLAQEGAAWLLTALEQDPHHRASHAALAKFYENQGNLTLAARHRQLGQRRDGAVEEQH
jgi:Flp pilus assembly protein TadD